MLVAYEYDEDLDVLELPFCCCYCTTVGFTILSYFKSKGSNGLVGAFELEILTNQHTTRESYLLCCCCRQADLTGYMCC